FMDPIVSGLHVGAKQGVGRFMQTFPKPRATQTKIRPLPSYSAQVIGIAVSCGQTSLFRTEVELA
ncbi:hypothetical protein, partial [Ideonella alba]